MAGTAELLIQVRADAGQATAILNELQMQTRQLEQIMGNTMPTAMSRTASETEKATGKFGDLSKEFANIGTMAAGLITGMAVTGASFELAELIKSAAEEFDKFAQSVAKVQRLTGESAESSSLLLGVLTRYGMTSDEASTALVKLDRSLAGIEDPLEVVQAGGKSGAAQLEQLGISAIDASGQLKSASQVMLELSDRIQGMTAAEQIGVISSVFKVRGQEAADLQRILAGGRDTIAAYVDELRATGNVINQEQVDDVLKFAQAHKELDNALHGLAITAGATFMPAVTAVAEELARFATVTDSYVVGGLHHVQDAISAVQGALGELKTKLDDTLGADVMSKIGTAANAVALGIPIVSGIVTAHDIAQQAPATAGGESTPTVAGLEQPASAASQPVATAKEAAANARANLQEITDAAAQRKADYDVAHVSAEQQALQLKIQQSEAEQQLLVYKQQIQDIDRQAVDYAQQLKDLDDQDAITKARLTESPLTAQNADLKYQQDLIKAQVDAARAAGTPVNVDAARAQLAELKRQQAELQPALLVAQHNTQLADRTKQTDDLQKSLHDTATTRAKIGVEESMQPLEDEAIARQRAAESAQRVLELDKQRFELSEVAYKTQQLMAEATQRAAEHTQYLLEHTVSATYGPPAPPAGTPPPGGAPISQASGEPAVQVHVGDIHVAQDAGNIVQQVVSAVTQQLEAALNAAMQHSPVSGQLGGNYQGVAAR